MAGHEANREAGKMDFPVHERNYSGFISSCCIVDETTGAPPRVE